ncbi:MAG: hypothetical protein ACU837_00115 [Gammaproteobacteria bacterium]
MMNMWGVLFRSTTDSGFQPEILIILELILNISKKILIALAIVLPAASFTQVAVAEETAAEAKVTAANPAQTVVTHIEAALSFLVGKGDLSNAQPHIKAALETARGITGNAEVVKEAWNYLVKGRIETKRGNPDNAIKALNEAVKVYKSL